MHPVWLVPFDESSFQRTMAEPIDLTDAPNKPEEFLDEARVWGVRTDPDQGTWSRNRRNLELMETGDPLVIYRNSVSKYTATGHVGPFWHMTYIRDMYWDGGPAIDVYSVEDYEEVDLSPETVNGILGYKENFWHQGLWRVADNRPVGRLLRKLDRL